jgi:hypothetical protein
VLGVVLDQDNAFRVLDLGPAADSDDTAKFR